MEEFDGKTILFYRGRNYIPQDENLSRDIVKMFHDHETAGHPGEVETFNSIKHPVLYTAPLTPVVSHFVTFLDLFVTFCHILSHFLYCFVTFYCDICDSVTG